MLSKLILTSLYGGSYGAMQSYIFNHRSMHISDGLNICPALSSMALLRFGWQGRFSSNNFSPAFWRSWHLPIIGIFSFAMCVIQHLGLLENLEGSSPFLGVPLRLFICLIFLEEALKLLANLVSTSMRDHEYFPLYPISVIFSCSRVFEASDCSSLVVFLLNLFPWSTCVTVAMKFLEGLILDCKQCPRKSSPYLLFLLFFEK